MNLKTIEKLNLSTKNQKKRFYNTNKFYNPFKIVCHKIPMRDK